MVTTKINRALPTKTMLALVPRKAVCLCETLSCSESSVRPSTVSIIDKHGVLTQKGSVLAIEESSHSIVKDVLKAGPQEACQMLLNAPTILEATRCLFIVSKEVHGNEDIAGQQD
jgi:hypothetical protein